MQMVEKSKSVVGPWSVRPCLGIRNERTPVS